MDHFDPWEAGELKLKVGNKNKGKTTKLFMCLTDPWAGAGEAITHRAALSLRRDDLLAVRQRLTLNLVADWDTIVANTNATRCGLPDVVVLVDLPFGLAALTFIIWSYSMQKWQQHKIVFFILAQ